MLSDVKAEKIKEKKLNTSKIYYITTKVTKRLFYKYERTSGTVSQYSSEIP